MKKQTKPFEALNLSMYHIDDKQKDIYVVYDKNSNEQVEVEATNAEEAKMKSNFQRVKGIINKSILNKNIFMPTDLKK
jgi:hypothetical protein